MVEVRLYVEGGGDTRAQGAPLREALRRWIERSGLPIPRRLQIITCGSRREAYERFCGALADHPRARCLLLVDSEGPVGGSSRWQHVRERPEDAWTRPADCDERQLHFMAQVMETWLLADPEALERYFQEGFATRGLPGHPNLEVLSKDDVYRRLKEATRGSRRGEYRKGRDLGLLGLIDPNRVQARCPHAGIFLRCLADSVHESPA